MRIALDSVCATASSRLWKHHAPCLTKVMATAVLCDLYVQGRRQLFQTGGLEKLWCAKRGKIFGATPTSGITPTILLCMGCKHAQSTVLYLQNVPEEVLVPRQDAQSQRQRSTAGKFLFLYSSCSSYKLVYK